ncbi:MAG: helix-hairpin-helix domain-containing protein [Ginsengibacter sp.]
MAMIELVDYNTIYGKGIGETASTTKKTRRAGRGKKVAGEHEEVVAKSEPAAVSDPVETETNAAGKTKSKKGDDLTKIEGIGPKAAEVLHEAGITSFAKLAESKAEDIKEILEKSGGHFNAQDPTSWPEQAQLAEDEKWDELKELQDKLIAGR